MSLTISYTNTPTFKTGNLIDLTDGTSMFYSTSGLRDFSVPLQNLTDGSYMFQSCPELTSFSSDLPSLTTTNGMFLGCTSLTSFTGDLSSVEYMCRMFADSALESFNSNLPSLKNYGLMFEGCCNLSYVNVGEFHCTTAFQEMVENLPNTNGIIKFNFQDTEVNKNMVYYVITQSWTACTDIGNGTEYISELYDYGSGSYEYEDMTSYFYSLVDGSSMFYGDTSLTSFTYQLPVLQIGCNMFESSGILSWNIDTPKLEYGNYMFASGPISSFEGDLSSLLNGYCMFSGCTDLTSFTSDLSNLSNGNDMFCECTSLSSVTSDGRNVLQLPSLQNGENMFRDCSLTFSTALSIFNSLPTITTGNQIFFTVSDDLTSSIASDLRTMQSNNKGWDVIVNFKNASGTISTAYSLSSAKYLFYNSSITSFSANIASYSYYYLDTSYMFYNCKNLTSFTGYMVYTTNTTGMFKDSTITTYNPSGATNSITTGDSMFENCSKLTSVMASTSQTFPSLLSANKMFFLCTSLTSFSKSMPKVTNTKSMFYGCKNLKTFSPTLNTVTDASYMFYGCTALTAAGNSNALTVQNLQDGSYMFCGCTNLQNIDIHTSYKMQNLTKADYMFYNCYLTKASVNSILSNLPTMTDGKTRNIHIGCSKTSCYTNGVVDSTITTNIASAKTKGWTPYLSYR